MKIIDNFNEMHISCGNRKLIYCRMTCNSNTTFFLSSLNVLLMSFSIYCRHKMRILPRGRRKESLVLFLSTCSVLGFIKLNSVIDGYPHTSINLAGQFKCQ